MYIIFDSKGSTATVCLTWHSSVMLRTESGIGTWTASLVFTSIPQGTRIFKSMPHLQKTDLKKCDCTASFLCVGQQRWAGGQRCAWTFPGRFWSPSVRGSGKCRLQPVPPSHCYSPILLGLKVRESFLRRIHQCFCDISGLSFISQHLLYIIYIHTHYIRSLQKNRSIESCIWQSWHHTLCCEYNEI